METSIAAGRRRSRFWLYAPYALLLLLVAAWSVGWWAIRGRVVSGLDDWVAAEKTAGRNWVCSDRNVVGYPFRIELTCASLSVEAPDTVASLGRLVVVAQIYNPSHVIAEASGPLRLQSSGTTMEANWTLLQTSVHLDGDKPRRGDLVGEALDVSATLPDGTALPFEARRLEIHLRPNPTDGANVDVALDVAGTPVPALTPITGSGEPIDIALVSTVTGVRDLPRQASAPEIERWRLAGGRVDLTRIVASQSGRRIEGRGALSIDDAHRPQGQFELAGQGVEEIVGRFFGGRAAGAAGLIGALLGAPPPAESKPGAGRLTPLPPIRLAQGRLFVGPLATPVRLPALY